MRTTSTYPKGVVAFFIYVGAFLGSLWVGFSAYKPPFAGAITLVAAVTTARYVKDWWLIEGADEAAAGMLDPGSFVKVTGTAQPHGDLQTAPDGTECAFWRYVLQYKGHGTNDGNSWSAVGSGIGEPYFVVNDGTGAVIVDGEAEATYHIDANRFSREGPTWVRIDEQTREEPQIQEILDAHDPSDHGDLRLSVSHIEPGEDVLVVGQVDTITGPDGREREILTRDESRDVFIIGDADESHVSSVKKFAVLFHGGVAIAAGYWTATLLTTHWAGTLPV